MRYLIALFLLALSPLCHADELDDLKKIVSIQQVTIAQLQSQLAGLSVENGTLKLQGKTLAQVEGEAVVWKGSPSGLKGDKGDKGDRGDKGDKGDKGDQGNRGGDGINGTNATVCGKSVKIQGNLVTGAAATFQFNRSDGRTAVTADRGYINTGVNSENFVLICP